MNKRNILAAVVLLIVEALIITVMLILPFAIPTRVRVLDMVVLSIILWMVGYDLFRPLVNLVVKHPTEVGSLGVRWSGQIIYMLLAIGLGVVGVVMDIPFVYQLLGQILLFGFLLLNYFASSSAARMVNRVAQKEEAVLESRQQMRTAIKQLQDEIAISQDIPAYFQADINELEEKLRYISPCENTEAREYEKQFADIARRMIPAMSQFLMNEDMLKQDVLRLKRLVENRKQTRN